MKEAMKAFSGIKDGQREFGEDLKQVLKKCWRLLKSDENNM